MTTPKTPRPPVDFIHPLPPDWYGQAWTWIQTLPMVDEVVTFERFSAQLPRLQTWGLLVDGQAVGAVIYSPSSARLGTLNLVGGAAVFGDVGAGAVARICGLLQQIGVEKIQIMLFAGDTARWRVFKALGARGEGVLKRQAMRDGVPVAVWLSALFLSSLVSPLPVAPTSAPEVIH